MYPRTAVENWRVQGIGVFGGFGCLGGYGVGGLGGWGVGSEGMYLFVVKILIAIFIRILNHLGSGSVVLDWQV